MFFEKVARCYWLVATLYEKFRGTPHNAMLWLNAIYRYHALPPPIPKKEHFYLDNTMLVLPIELVIDKWFDFFEPTLDQVLSTKKVNALLKDNGLLMEVCSEKIRHNRESALLAMRNNENCFKFLTLPLQQDSEILALKI